MGLKALFRNSSRVQQNQLKVAAGSDQKEEKVIEEVETIATKFVRYDDEIAVLEIPSIDDLTDQEFYSLWLSKEEIVRIKKRERRLLKQVFYEGDVGPDDDAFGLESKEKRYDKHMLIDESIKSVLGEQHRQDKSKARDPDRIAWVYSRTSVESISLAHERGLTNHYQLLEMNRPHRRRWSMDNMQKTQEQPLRRQRRSSMRM